MIDGAIQISELCLHVDGAFAANRTLVGRFHVLIVTSFVYSVTTEHEHHWRRGSEHIFSTDRAVAVRDSLNTFV